MEYRSYTLRWDKGQSTSAPAAPDSLPPACAPLLRRFERAPRLALWTGKLPTDERMRKVLGGQDVANVLAIHREVPARAAVIAPPGSFAARAA
jgi:hypothetical protein